VNQVPLHNLAASAAELDSWADDQDRRLHGADRFVPLNVLDETEDRS
jgi:hypothetical protein